MPDLQSKVIDFHNQIKVEEEELRTSRDALLTKICQTLKDKGLPTPGLINQGSYIYGVGIKPIADLEHDIDVGLEFNICADDYDPKTIRGWVLDAVKDHTKEAPEEKTSCIRVRYQAGYHVDLVIYAKYKTKREKETDQENHQIALKNGEWRPSEPKKLKQFIQDEMNKFKSTANSGSGNQLQRVVRSLKRWNDEALPFESDDKPVGLALLLFAIKHLSPTFDKYGKVDDLHAIKTVADQAAGTFGRITCDKPTQEFEDIFGKISENGMEDLKARFSKLSDTIKAAQESESLADACKLLQTVFGLDFPDGEDDRPKSSRSKSEILSAAVADTTQPTQPWRS